MPFKKSWVKIILASAAGILMLTACGRANDSSSDSTSELPKIIIGCDKYPPYNFEDESGQPTGIDIDLARESFARLGYEPEFVTINWEEKNDLLDSGEIDCIWSSYTIDGREDKYNWTIPYLYSRQVIAVREDSDIYTLADLADRRLAVQSTTKPEDMFLEGTDPRLPKLREIISLQDQELIYPFLSKGYADAIAAHEVVIAQNMSNYDLHYRILDEPLLTVGLGVAFSINDERGINDRLSEVFEQMYDDGSFEEILGKYLEDPHKYLEVKPLES